MDRICDRQHPLLSLLFITARHVLFLVSPFVSTVADSLTLLDTLSSIDAQRNTYPRRTTLHSLVGELTDKLSSYTIAPVRTRALALEPLHHLTL